MSERTQDITVADFLRQDSLSMELLLPAKDGGGFPWDMETGGLTFTVQPRKKRFNYSVGGQWHSFQPGAVRAIMHFPGHERDSITISEALGGLITFFDRLDEIQSEDENQYIPDYLYGATNPKTAMFARRIGFQLIDRKESTKNWEIIASTQEVRDRVNTLTSQLLSKSKLYDLLKRSKREKQAIPVVTVIDERTGEMKVLATQDSWSTQLPVFGQKN